MVFSRSTSCNYFFFSLSLYFLSFFFQFDHWTLYLLNHSITRVTTFAVKLLSSIILCNTVVYEVNYYAIWSCISRKYKIQINWNFGKKLVLYIYKFLSTNLCHHKRRLSIELLNTPTVSVLHGCPTSLYNCVITNSVVKIMKWYLEWY